VVNDDVVLRWLPAAAPAGTCSVTLNVHDAPAAREPPERVSKEVPEIWDAGPHTVVAS
jgi:hypothetical protein